MTIKRNAANLRATARLAGADETRHFFTARWLRDGVATALLSASIVGCGAPPSDEAVQSTPAPESTPSSVSSPSNELAQNESLRHVGAASAPAAAEAGPMAGAIRLERPDTVLRPAIHRVDTIPEGATLTKGAIDSRFPSGPTDVVSYSNQGIGACPTQVTKHAGGSIAKPNTGMVFWGSAWNLAPNTDTRATFSANTQWLSTTYAFWNRLNEYGVSAGGSYRGTFTYTGGVTGANLTEAQIRSGITDALTNTAHLAAGVSDIWVVMLPPGSSSQTDVVNGWSGHHDHYTASFSGTNVDVKYAVIEPSLGDTGAVISHELMEAASDPDLNGWFVTNGGEIGDLCRGVALPGGAGSIGNRPVETVWSQKACACVMEKNLNALDFNGTGTPNKTVVRNGLWIPNGGSPNWNFLGIASDIPYGGDYDGDGRTEFSLFRDGNPGTVFVLNVASGVYTQASFGKTGDIPVPGDYDGDGLTDVAVWTPATGVWTIRAQSTLTSRTVQWGQAGDIPVPADYDGDHKTDFAILRPSTHTWWVAYANGNPSAGATWDVTTGDVPVPGDFNGDGKADFAYWRPTDATWHVSYQFGAAFIKQWGQNGDKPVAIDYDGDYQSDMAVWRPSNGTWYVISSGTQTGGSVQWGQNGDVPAQRWPIR
jgi:hypothetical protein